MKTLKLIGLGNDQLDKRSSFLLEKSEFFQQYLNEILKKIGIDDQIYEEEPIDGRIDEIDHFKNEDYDIDVVYTTNKIVILVRAEQINLERFKSLILTYSKMDE